ncbi:MAG: endonuclease/exonuclease/phosphatase family protein [Acidimicrobiia bacterium]|nr:endonuclease/exonuclease/phosphatase family protein [Acidimicrobiia bacterium]
MKKLAFLVLAAVFLAATPAQASDIVRVEVMSQNLYIGADLGRLLAGEPPAALLQTVQQTNFPERAVEIAEAIDDFNPDLLGLQEVSLISVFDAEGNVLLQLDYLGILMAAIAAEGENYAVASSVTNSDVVLPVDPEAGTSARVVDRDVIIYRTTSTTVSNPQWANFTTNFQVEVFGFPIEFTRGWTAVDAEVGGQSFRFVNTHLEVEGAPCVVGDVPVICQDVQAAELAGELADENLPIVLVGDINAEPGATAYETFASGGYTDTWTIRFPYNNEPGFTCCQSEALDNVESELDERIDHIFISDDDLDPVFTLTTVVGDWEERKTPGGLWYSDHGGPWARMYLRFQ